jgi:TPR repeat protein
MNLTLILFFSALMPDAGSLPGEQTGLGEGAATTRIPAEPIRSIIDRTLPADQTQDVPAALQKSAEKGNGRAQGKLGWAYYFGQGVPQDYAQAVYWLRQAADQGVSLAQFGLGIAYYHGQGVPQDYAQAVHWLRQAADQGVSLAQFNLGSAYHSGQGVPQDYSEGIRWWKKAADQGHAPAQEGLGLVYDLGRGVPQDYEEAARWYRKAADQGVATAQKHLGLAYYKGQGVPQDKAKAYFWATLAVALNKDEKEESFAKVRDSIARTLTRAQLSATQKRCRQWMDAFEKRKAQKR